MVQAANPPNPHKFTICAEDNKHIAAIEVLIQDSFGEGTRKKRTIYQFRDQIAPLHDLCFVAIDEADDLIGSIRFWPSHLSDGTLVPLLGPLAVQPQLRGQGAGRQLIDHGLNAAKAAGYKGVLISGDPGYYVPLGFSVTVVENLYLPGPVTPLSFMGIEFEEGFLHNSHGLVSPSDS